MIKDVTAAIVIEEGRVLIARRGPGQRHAGMWEFPGGKLEPGESAEACLRRELAEEFHIEARIGSFVGASNCLYGHGAIRLLAYRVELGEAPLTLIDHDAVRWVTGEELRAAELLPADRPLADLLLKNQGEIAMTESFHFAPSECHHHLMNTQPPQHAFAGGKVSAWQQALGPIVAEKLGLPNMPAERVPLNVRSLWKREHPAGTIEKIVFTSEPCADVPAYVCLPHGVKPPYRFFICLQGHSTGAHNSIALDRETESQPIAIEGDRDFGIGCMQRGIPALCIEQRSFGLRRELRLDPEPGNHGCYMPANLALMLGRTLVGERVFDVDRGIDYLAARGDVDMDRIGVMGNSGGGTVSLFAAAVLPRLAYAMPSCYFCTFRHSIMSVFHCLDNYLPGLLREAEMPDVMGLFAPKPVVLVAGQTDGIFPIAGVQEAYAHLLSIYRAAGAAEKCRLVVGPEGHRFYADLAWPVMQKLMD